ncbi:MAG: glycosyltransferase family 25 protein [Chlamydiae bacterium]|nr:glycosyltransferase family 25 protein [Chlamydiota bacterium]
MKLIYSCLLLFASCFCHAEFTNFLKKDTANKIEKSSIENIDFIYLINLDQRPEKLTKVLERLMPYKIQPHRFSAVFGAGLSVETINNIGLNFTHGMSEGELAVSFSSDGPEGSRAPSFNLLNKDSYGKTVFFRTMTAGAIGCAMSHLSVLQDAYDAGYQTVWVLEDDIVVKQDPHTLSRLIKKLDDLVGKEGWDVLYTDTDASDAFTTSVYNKEQDFEKDLVFKHWFFNRPDMTPADHSSLAKRTVISEDFVKIGSRMRTHSMIIRRSGMKKILDFEKERHIFIPYDHEIALVPDIRMYNLRYDVVTNDTLSESDTHIGGNSLSGPTATDLFPVLYQLGLTHMKENYSDSALDAFFKSYSLRPTRAEPLFQCAKIYREKGNVLLGYLLTKHALSLSRPTNELFIDSAVYDYALLVEYANCSLGLGKFAEGFDACAKLLSNPALPSEYRPKVQANYEVARNRLGNSGPNLTSKDMSPDSQIHEHGYWIGANIMHEHKFDPLLAKALVNFFNKENVKTVADFGCGVGDYVKTLRQQEIQCDGYDGNPESPKISGGIVKVLDLSQSFSLEKRFDWVLCLEVGEHLPKKYETTLIENLHKHNAKGIILSWAVKGQGGYGHFNEQSNDYVKDMMSRYGYENDIEAETILRHSSSLPWFKNTIMVFRKK